ncbi:hypothetical protein [Paenibacillus glucanolyticus]|uniref:hypothetical protein n=1 Tax=Paenibacillus glucanolyticus TaxID=59843 RepID=UPI0030D3B24D
MTFKIEGIMKSLNFSLSYLKEDYELDDINTFTIEFPEKIQFGYRIIHNNVVYTALLNYKKINGTECTMEENFVWHLYSNGQEQVYNTIAQLMDALHGLNVSEH